MSTDATPNADTMGGAAAIPRRNYFRLKVYDAGCTFAYSEQVEAGELVDVGGGGARFRVATGDWSVRDEQAGRLSFRLSDADFEFPCRLIRKVDDGEHLQYVAVWHHPRQTEIDRLVQAIYRIELARPRPVRHGTQAAPRRNEGLRRKLTMGLTAGLALGGLVFLVARVYALPVWASLTCASAVIALVEG